MPHNHPVRKRELTVFDLPPIGTPEFSTHVRKPSLTVFHQLSRGDSQLRKSKTKLTPQKAHLRLRELTENNLASSRAPSDAELHKTALDYLLNRSKSTDSWFQQPRHIVYDRAPIKDGTREVRDAFTQLSILPPVTSRGEPILRRPGILGTRQVSEGGDVFNVILKNKEMIPFSFDGDLKMARDFYASHYPLLMRKMLEASPSNSRRVSFVTEEIAREFVKHTSAERRLMKLNERSRLLEEVLKSLEDEDEDEFVTELRHDVFNPLLWHWNQND